MWLCEAKKKGVYPSLFLLFVATIFHISFPHHRSRILRMPKVSKIIIRIDVNFSPLSDNKCALVSFSIRMVSSLAIDAKFWTFTPRRSNSIKLGLGEGVPCHAMPPYKLRILRPPSSLRVAKKRDPQEKKFWAVTLQIEQNTLLYLHGSTITYSPSENVFRLDSNLRPTKTFTFKQTSKTICE